VRRVHSAGDILLRGRTNAADRQHQLFKLSGLLFLLVFSHVEYDKNGWKNDCCAWKISTKRGRAENCGYPYRSSTRKEVQSTTEQLSRSNQTDRCRDAKLSRFGFGRYRQQPCHIFPYCTCSIVLVPFVFVDIGLGSHHPMRQSRSRSHALFQSWNL
jgi:hypothetical protein